MKYLGSVFSEQYQHEISIEIHVDDIVDVSLEKLKKTLNMNQYETFDNDIIDIKMVVGSASTYMNIEIIDIKYEEKLKMLLSWNESSRSFTISIKNITNNGNYHTLSLFNKDVIDFVPMDAVKNLTDCITVYDQFSAYLQFILYVVNGDSSLFYYYG